VGIIPPHHAAAMLPPSLLVQISGSIICHLKLASVAWCNVFGSYKEDLHWTKTTAGEIPKQVQEDFRQRVLSETGFILERWETYQKDMMDFRNKYIAHFDLYKPFNGPIPSFDPALQVVYAYDEWVRNLSKPSIWEQPKLSLEYERFNAEASSVIKIFFPRSK